MATLAEPRTSSFFSHLQGTHRFSKADYLSMIEHAILTTADKVELLDGFILYKLDYVELQPSEYFPEYAQLRRFTLAEYNQLIGLGILTTEDRLELLDGYLVNKMPQYTPHSSTTDRLVEDVKNAIPSGWRARCQLPIELETSAPEPDLAIVRGNRRTYDLRHPRAEDFGVVMEVSDSSLHHDRRYKRKLYSSVGIPSYWLINIEDMQIEVYTDPTATGYGTRTDFKPGDAVPLILDGVEVAKLGVADLLP